MLMKATHNEPAQQEPADADLEACPMCDNDMRSRYSPFCSAECRGAYVRRAVAEDEAYAQEVCEARDIAQQEEEK
jgi:endogenous inhibitor of DNA gyrase (YacG/DUF329 family)